MGKYKQKNSEIDTFHAVEPKIMTPLPAGMYMETLHQGVKYVQI